jgi:hypothetical protein
MQQPVNYSNAAAAAAAGLGAATDIAAPPHA